MQLTELQDTGCNLMLEKWYLGVGECNDSDPCAKMEFNHLELGLQAHRGALTSACAMTPTCAKTRTLTALQRALALQNLAVKKLRLYKKKCKNLAASRSSVPT